MDYATRRTIKTYDATVDDFYENVKNKKATLDILDEFSKLLPSGARVLDAGCGPGIHAGRFVSKNFHVVGIDLSANMIKFARKMVPGAEFHVMDIADLGFDDGTFDAVWMNFSLIHVRKSKAPHVLSEASRVLRAGGLLYIGAKLGSGESMMRDGRYGGKEKLVALYQMDEIVRLVGDSGFLVTEADVRGKEDSYDTNQNIKIFCRKQDI